jgi:hypothetical protein
MMTPIVSRFHKSAKNGCDPFQIAIKLSWDDRSRPFHRCLPRPIVPKGSNARGVLRALGFNEPVSRIIGRWALARTMLLYS